MKNYILFFVIVFALSSCEEDKIDNNDKSKPAGNWKITLYQNDLKNETDKFNGYTFAFEDNNVINASKGSLKNSGTWLFGDDDSKPKFIMTFTSGKPLSELNEDWRVLTRTKSLMSFEHTSGNNDVDLLTLELIK